MGSQHFISFIRAHDEVAPGYFLLTLELPPMVKKPRPGEFFMVKVGRDSDPLLRRPLSLYRLISEDTLQVLYRNKGKGTMILSERKQGEKLDLIGPLGRGFEIPSTIDEAILVAGGIGVASLYSLAKELKGLKKQVKLFLGVRSKKDILCDKEFEALGFEIFISTEDSSYGRKGLITELLEGYLKGLRLNVHSSRIYACGPNPMLKELSNLARIYSFPCYVSLEERMACGVGACQGCAVKIKVQSSKPSTRDFGEPSGRASGRGLSRAAQAKGFKVQKYKMVCKDGPVFNSEEIDWE